MDEWMSSSIANSNMLSQQVANEVAYNNSVENYLKSPEGQVAGILNQLNMHYRDYDNAWSARQAEIQRNWSAEEAEKNRIFNMQEAEKNRLWQQYMSSTAHSREVQDLLEAGLNPILSVMGGNGSSVGSGATANGVGNPSGASANGNQSAGMAIASILSTVLANQQRMSETLINADLVREQNELSRGLSLFLGELGADTSRYGAEQSAGAIAYSAMQSAMASMYGSDLSLQGSMYKTDKDYDLGKKRIEADSDIAMLGRSNSLDIAEKEIAGAMERIKTQIEWEAKQQGIELEWKSNHPQTTMAGARYVGEKIGEVIAALVPGSPANKNSGSHIPGTVVYNNGRKEIHQGVKG